MEGAAAAWLKAAHVPVRRSKPLLSFRDEIAAARRDAAFDDAADTITPRGRSLRKPLVSLPMDTPCPCWKLLASARTLVVEMLTIRPLQSRPALMAMQSSPVEKVLCAM